MIEKHASWFRCADCNVAFLEKHPKRCFCGSRKFSEVMTEDTFTYLGQKEHEDCTAVECAERNGFDLYRGPED